MASARGVIIKLKWSTLVVLNGGLGGGGFIRKMKHKGVDGRVSNCGVTDVS